MQAINFRPPKIPIPKIQLARALNSACRGLTLRRKILSGYIPRASDFYRSTPLKKEIFERRG
jgi:hypothetical protein